MNERILELRKRLGLTQTEFAERLGLTKNFISLLENGGRAASERTISDICSEFDVDRIWLETGAGEPFRPKTKQEELAVIFGDVLSGNPTIKNKFIEAVSLLPEEAYPYIVQSILDIADHLRSDSQEEE